MRVLLGLIGAAAAIIVAAPGHAEPGATVVGAVDASPDETATFIAALRTAGISFADPEQAVAAGQAVCGVVANGAAQFAAIAARSYCPHQLEAAGKPAK